jgi:2-polyprenyl-6-methoxyphenol hydroxylase-like FAD-dependent oxidoreductase
MMLGLLLARAGIRVVVLEKHRDFLRDFRGDTIHPSTLEVLHELGILEPFLALPHQKVAELRAQFGNEQLLIAEFRGVRARCPFIAMIPQWDFLDFLARHAKRWPGFELRMECEVEDLLIDAGKVVGVKTSQGDVLADLVVGADGRHSLVREKAGLEVIDFGAPIDALWFRLPRQAGDGEGVMGRFDRGSILVMLNRGDYWQCAFVIAKGTLEVLKRRGIDSFRGTLAGLFPFATDRMRAIASWDDVKLLVVQVNRLRRWYRDGLVCIGDAAHAMSPVGGVGINLAIQDAVAAANQLAAPLREGRVTVDGLRRVQERRELPTRLTQWVQVQFQRRIIAPVLGSSAPLPPPLFLRLVDRFPFLRGIPARMVGFGVRPEHVRPL